MNTLSERLGARGWRMTAQRRVIAGVFDVTPQGHLHLTADEVHERAVRVLPEISRATVYNALGELVDAGELLAVQTGGRVTRYDPNVAGVHHHLVCTYCHAIFDVPAQAVPLPEMPIDFTVESAEVIFRGRCSNCG